MQHFKFAVKFPLIVIVLLFDVHSEVAFDGPLGDECAAHTGQSLPVGQDSRTVHVLLRESCRLFDQLTKDLRIVLTNMQFGDIME